jgi:hypothetical protein
VLGLVGFSMKEPIYVAVEFLPYGDLRSLLNSGSVASWELRLRLAWYAERKACDF